MSEYQYYEFRAIDRPLSREEQAELRRFSSRARISTTRFTNTYHFGSFKGDWRDWISRYFDAHLYTSNFGSRIIAFRFPIGWIDSEALKPYETECAVEVRETPTHLHLALIIDSESGFEDVGDEDSEDQLETMLPLRDAIARGDFRALYLAWLSAMVHGNVDDDTEEPPVPAGLSEVNDDPALASLMSFLDLTDPQVEAAAQASGAADPESTTMDVAAWLVEVDAAQKDQWLANLLATPNPATARAILAHQPSRTSGTPMLHPVRTAAELVAITEKIEKIADDKRRREAAEKEHARILALKGQEDRLWESVIKLSESTSQNYQNTAIHTLKDLKKLAEVNGTMADFRARFGEFVEARQKRKALLNRFKDAGLL